MSDLQLSELYIHPVKSLGGIAVAHSAVDRFGLHDDRRWMVVDANDRYVTQRERPHMARIATRLDGERLSLAAPGLPPLSVSPCADGEPREVTVWDDRVNARDCGEDAAAWLGEALGITCRLVYFPDQGQRQVDLAFAQPGDLTAFSDGFPLLLISQASLDDLNTRLAEAVPMRRFRPNLVVSGSTPYAEDGWRRLRIGDLSLRVVKPCSRCVIPTIDPATGQRHPEVEPLRTLGEYRRRNNKIYFGQNVIADGKGDLAVGMPVTVLE